MYNEQEEQAKLDKKAENKRNAANNAQVIRVAAKAAEKAPNPYVAAAGKIVTAADRITGGKSTELLGSVQNKIQPKSVQKKINKVAESGAAQVADIAISAKNGKAGDKGKKTDPKKKQTPPPPATKGKPKSSSKTDEKTTKKGPIIIVIGLVLLLLPAIIGMLCIIMVVSAVFSYSSTGNVMYGKTCPVVTVNTTGCDSNGQNCTNKYDGDVELEEYIAGVVAARNNGGNLEYYKAEAITARTYLQSNLSDNCTITGNSNEQPYMDVDDSTNSQLIRQAVEATKELVLINNDNLVMINNNQAHITKADNEYYHISYITSSQEEKTKKIPKTWDSDISNPYSGYMAEEYAKIGKNSTNSNNNYKMNQVVALYLTTKENYTYSEVLKYYYGSEVEVKKNEMMHIGAEGFINPTRSIRCTSAYGYRIHPVKQTRKFHSGLDIGISGGEPIYAVNDGTITYVRKNISSINNCNYGYGNYITIDHGNGKSTLYAHIKYGTIPDNIVTGATVTQGEIIGQVGSTGCSTGNHLHYEFKENGKTVDPTNYLDLTGATGTCKR